MKDIDNEEVLKGTGAVVEVNSLEDFFTLLEKENYQRPQKMKK